MIGTRLREYRLEKGLKSAEMAARMGISQGGYSGLENNKSDPSAESLKNLIKRTNINLYWLLTGKGNPERDKDGISLNSLPRPAVTFVKNIKEIPSDIRIEEYVTIPLVAGSIAAGDPIISEEMIEGWAVIQRSQVGKRENLVAIKLDEKDGKSMEPLIRAGSMVAIDREDKEIVKGKPFAVRTSWGCTVKFVKRAPDALILIPQNKDYEPEILDLGDLSYDPIVGRVIWNWQTF
jgi:phage repressor protein C with HTH and peptisase S24 domain